jgi:hypothetical protein
MISRTAGQRFRINNYHKLVLDAATNHDATPDYHEKNIIRFGARILPGLHERTLKRAFDKLVERHESLRLRFVDDTGDWQAEILAKHPVGLLVENISDLSVTEQNTLILKRSLEPMTALSHPLFEMVLFKGGETGDVVLARAQHAIIDGYSLVILIEDMLKLIIRMPLGARPPTYENYIQRNLQSSAKDNDSKEVFWRSNLLPAAGDLNIGRKAKGLAPASWRTTGKSLRLENILSPEEAEALATRAKVTGVTPFAYLYAAYSETLCGLAGQSQVIVNSVIGRADPATKGFVCADQQPIGIRYVCNPDSLEERAVWLSEMLRQAIAASPTQALLPDGPILTQVREAGATWFRFLAHMPNPTGRLATSAFSKLFDKAQVGTISIGPLRFERLDLTNDAEIDSEVQLTVTQVNDRPNVTIFAEAASYDDSDLAAIGQGIRDRLAQMQLDGP